MVCCYAHVPHRLIRASALLLALILACWVAPGGVAHADSPFDDPAFRPPQGGGTSSRAGTTTASIPSIPAGYTEIPPPSSIRNAPAGRPYGQQGPLQNPNDPLAWLQLGFNPGKWLLDSVLGAVSGIILSVAGVFQSLALWGLGTPDGGGSAASGYISDSIMFSTPLQYTIVPGISSSDAAITFNAQLPPPPPITPTIELPLPTPVP